MFCIGDEVVYNKSKMTGVVVKQYYSTPRYTLVKMNDGRLLRDLTSEFRMYKEKRY